MCTTKAPKAPPPEKKKPVQYLSNPWVDGLGIVGSGARGRNSLRIDPGSPRVPVTPLPPGNPTPPAAPPRPDGTTLPNTGSRFGDLFIKGVSGDAYTRRQQARWDAQYASK